MSESTHWALPLLASGQAQKEITHNEAVLAIDRLLHLAVTSRSLSDPPLEALPGDTYIVAAAPTGAWAGSMAKLATFDGGGWTIIAPRAGCLAWIVDEGEFAVFGASGWSTGGWPTQALRIGDRRVLGEAPEAIAVPAGGGTIDSECRAALAALLVALGNQGVINQTV